MGVRGLQLPLSTSPSHTCSRVHFPPTEQKRDVFARFIEVLVLFLFFSELWKEVALSLGGEFYLAGSKCQVL